MFITNDKLVYKILFFYLRWLAYLIIPIMSPLTGSDLRVRVSRLLGVCVNCYDPCVLIVGLPSSSGGAGAGAARGARCAGRGRGAAGVRAAPGAGQKHHLCAERRQLHSLHTRLQGNMPTGNYRFLESSLCK